MNKDTRNTFALILCVLIVIIIAATVLKIVDPTGESFIGEVAPLLAFIGTIVAVLVGKRDSDKQAQEQKEDTDEKLSVQDETLKVIKANVNGNLTAKEAEIARKNALLLDNGIHPETGKPVTESIPTTRRESLDRK